jgi:BirA family biotin operon repressor/biotin-[acetyl-CoA-carboxylase] ligase
MREHRDSLDSTNSETLRRLKTEALPEGFLLTTDYQTSGRGYAGSRWEAEPGENILMSLLLKPTQVLGDVIQNAVCGIGFNVNQNFFDAGLNATSLALESRKKYDLGKAIAALCASVEVRYLQLLKSKVELIQKEYMERLYQLESYEDYRILGKKMQAKIVGLNPEGKLVLDSEDGFKVCGFKEIEFLF